MRTDDPAYEAFLAARTEHTPLQGEACETIPAPATPDVPEDTTPGLPVDASARLTRGQVAALRADHGLLGGLGDAAQRQACVLLRRALDAEVARDAALVACEGLRGELAVRTTERNEARAALVDVTARAHAAAQDLAEELAGLRRAHGGDFPRGRTGALAALHLARGLLETVDHRARHAIDTALVVVSQTDGPPAQTEVERFDATPCGAPVPATCRDCDVVGCGQRVAAGLPADLRGLAARDDARYALAAEPAVR